ncbi:MAG: glutamine synthetase family protein [Sedimentibacter sp.]|uniref:glutamine synthetase family protein n=1 Tax=Sedimentibacter sp. TaxID=1960295 RepID=UPI002981AD3B|nr:glutamine synthetase family protein [Sedimentibacter sp.]MDW5298869.1 glutamine synthetase family protein [Sedimentibacter sp.]
MKYTMNEVLQFINDNDVKFVRLSFCDIFGTVKNISILSEELPRAFESGISFDASSIRGFLNIEESDLFLYPDPSTLAILPWRPQQGRVIRFYCDIKYPDGTPFEGDGRAILQRAVDKAHSLGYKIEIGSECEFYLFEEDEKGYPTKVPHDNARYFDVAPLDRGENVRRDISLTLEQMGILPECSHHEQGPGQNEIDFKYSDAMSAADNLVTFKSVVKTIAHLNGLYASFMPKPLKDFSGSGLHINMSLLKNNINLFDNIQNNHSREAESFIAGILNRIKEITVFLNPLTNSYDRFGSHSAPKFVTWSYQNRSQLIRIPAASGKYSRMELRSSDPSCNPYYAFALLIYAGLEGIENELELKSPANLNLYQADEETAKLYDTIPDTLEKAIDCAIKSDFVAKYLPGKTLAKFLAAKTDECKQCEKSKNKEEFEHNTYFYTI